MKICQVHPGCGIPVPPPPVIVGDFNNDFNNDFFI
jgi:hypothetical protein